jgi:hypothetical protein
MADDEGVLRRRNGGGLSQSFDQTPAGIQAELAVRPREWLVSDVTRFEEMRRIETSYPAGLNFDSSRYKTNMCKFMLKGHRCSSRHCRFAHSGEELRYFRAGFRCVSFHGSDCTDSNCLFLHEGQLTPFEHVKRMRENAERECDCPRLDSRACVCSEDIVPAPLAGERDEEPRSSDDGDHNGNVRLDTGCRDLGYGCPDESCGKRQENELMGTSPRHHDGRSPKSASPNSHLLLPHSPLPMPPRPGISKQSKYRDAGGPWLPKKKAAPSRRKVKKAENAPTLQCTLCGTGMMGQDSYDNHIRGMPHRKKESQQSYVERNKAIERQELERKKAARASVLCGGSYQPCALSTDTPLSNLVPKLSRSTGTLSGGMHDAQDHAAQDHAAYRYGGNSLFNSDSGLGASASHPDPRLTRSSLAFRPVYLPDEDDPFHYQKRHVAPNRMQPADPRLVTTELPLRPDNVYMRRYAALSGTDRLPTDPEAAITDDRVRAPLPGAVNAPENKVSTVMPSADPRLALTYSREHQSQRVAPQSPMLAGPAKYSQMNPNPFGQKQVDNVPLPMIEWEVVKRDTGPDQYPRQQAQKGANLCAATLPTSADAQEVNSEDVVHLDSPMTVNEWRALEEEYMQRGGAEALAFKAVRDACLSGVEGVAEGALHAMKNIGTEPCTGKEGG